MTHLPTIINDLAMILLVASACTSIEIKGMLNKIENNEIVVIFNIRIQTKFYLKPNIQLHW